MKEVKTFEVNSNLGWWANFIKALFEATFGVIGILLCAIPVRGLSAYGDLSRIIKNGSIGNIYNDFLLILIVAAAWFLFIIGCVSLLLCMRENKNKYTFKQYSNASIVRHIVADAIFILIAIYLARVLTWALPGAFILLEPLCSFLFDALFVKYNWEKIYKTTKK